LSIQTQGTTILILLLLSLIFLSFIISGAEVALFSLGNKDINMLKTKQHPSAKRIVKLLDESKEVYTSLVISGTFINISIIVLSNFLINELLQLEGALVNLGSFSFIIELLIKVFIIAFILIFFCKILPKVWATQNNLRFAYGCSYVIEGIHFLLSVLSKRMVGLADNIGTKLGADKGRRASLKELDEAIDFTADDETTLEEKNILKGIVKFGNINVKQIMRSRLDVSGIEYSLTLKDLLKKIDELHFSRIPVYKTNLDEVIGVINTKDLLAYLNIEDIYSEDQKRFDCHILMRQPYFVPETKLIEDLLKEFQQKRIHFAIVVDEFGGTSGIVTMEDILEEIIGDIKDEFDDEESSTYKVDDENYIFEGRVMIHDMCRIMKLPIDTFDGVKGESESLAGLVLELAGEMPTVDWVIPCGDFEFEIMKADKNRVHLVKVTVKPRSVEE
jgi:gliding motility-associated protein GldE